MLMYHPAFDANHCLYRLIVILTNTKQKSLPWDLLRLLDFYYLFPSKIKEITPWPGDIKQYRSKIKNIEPLFEELTNPARVLYDLHEFQKTAVLELITKDVISHDAFTSGKVVLKPQNIPEGFLEFMNSDPFLNSEAFEVISKALSETDFLGPNGLKKRSRMMEYIYDPK